MPSPIAGGDGNQRILYRRAAGLSLAPSTAFLLPRHPLWCRTMIRPHRTDSNARSHACDVARGDFRNRQARAADRAHATRPDRHDDHRSRADRPARRWRDRGGVVDASYAVFRICRSAWDRFRRSRRWQRKRSARATRAWCGGHCASDCGPRCCSAFPLTSSSFGARTSCWRPARRPIPRHLPRATAGLAWWMIPAWCFIAIRNFMGAVNRPEPALWVTLAAIPINGILAYALIHGAFGLPRLDLLGAGLATTLVNIGMCGPPSDLLRHRAVQEISRARTLLAAGLASLGAAVRDRPADLGLDAAGVGPVLLGCAAGRLDRHDRACGPPDRAAGRALGLFMVPFGISIAATVRVGHAVGRRDRRRRGARDLARWSWG